MEVMGLHVDVGKKEISNHSFPTELNSMGDLRFLCSLGAWTLMRADIWTIVRASLSEGQRFQAPPMLLLRAGGISHIWDKWKPVTLRKKPVLARVTWGEEWVFGLG